VILEIDCSYLDYFSSPILKEPFETLYYSVINSLFDCFSNIPLLTIFAIILLNAYRYYIDKVHEKIQELQHEIDRCLKIPTLIFFLLKKLLDFTISRRSEIECLLRAFKMYESKENKESTDPWNLKEFRRSLISYMNRTIKDLERLENRIQNIVMRDAVLISLLLSTISLIISTLK